MITKLKSALFAATFASGLLLPAVMRADTLNVTLNPSTQTVAPGGTVTFSGTISAPLGNGAPIYVVSAEGGVFGPSDISFDGTDTLNLLGFPNDTVLKPGDSATGDLFTLSVPPTEALGPYLGSFFLVGGSASDYSGTDVFGTVPFTVNVGAPGSVTPEPSSYLLLATGLGGVFLLVRRQRTVLS